MKRIESLLNREIGLSARSIGQSAVEAAVRARMRACGTGEVAAYLEKLQGDASERRQLVEEIVVSETWFFRDDEVFKALRRHAHAWAASERVLRVLSLPCATGEEAYSVSITLLEAGLRSSRYAVRAVDVSERALAHARRAVYGKNSFRGVDMAQLKGYLEAADGGFHVAPAASAAVTFSSGNVLSAVLFGPKSFDVILCRNLLIYLDPEARARALDNLHSWLTDDGLLFAGHAEAVELMSPRFQRLADSSPFAYVKQARTSAEPARGAPSARTPGLARAHNSTRSSGRVRAAGAKPPVVPAEPRSAQASLERATELANRGSLQEARQLCERVITHAGASPDAYCLLGVISNAAGERDNAIACFNKSLYLDQAHYEALVHLALLHEQRGELPAAANFRRRAERARRGDGK